MARRKRTAWPPQWEAWLKLGTFDRVSIPCASEREAKRLRDKLYEFRNDTSIGDLAELRVEGKYLVIEPWAKTYHTTIGGKDEA
jgi:hypothetical protein